MPRSSLGFHTITLSLRLDKKTTGKLVNDFKKYSQDTHLIKIYHVNGNDIQLKYGLQDDGTYKTIVTKSRNLKITYYQKYKGIEWLIKYDNRSKDYKSYIIETTINPKILGGINDYITAATYDDMETAIENFNHEAKSISPILKDFHQYYLKRVDYCINFSLNELAPGCSPEQIVKLIKRADIPPYYKEWEEYDYKAHRTKSKNSSFYLINNSVNINCYMKHIELLERSQKYESNGYSQITMEMLNESQDIIRFEVQCKYLKMYALNRWAEETGNHKTNKYESLLTNEKCKEIISDYYKRSVGKGDWYTMPNAVHMIHSQHFNRQKEKRLIEALAQVNPYRSLFKVKSAYKGDDLQTFKRTLSDISSLGINPVTIPKDWGIKHIPNLLYVYFDKVSDESQTEIFDNPSNDRSIKKYGLSV